MQIVSIPFMPPHADPGPPPEALMAKWGLMAAKLIQLEAQASLAQVDAARATLAKAAQPYGAEFLGPVLAAVAKHEQDVKQALDDAGNYVLQIQNWALNAPPNMGEAEWQKVGTPFPVMPAELLAFAKATGLPGF
jgi:hypothetical protein